MYTANFRKAIRVDGRASAFARGRQRASGAVALGVARSIRSCSPVRRAAKRRRRHRPARIIRAEAKRVIWLTMAGGPSHLETLRPQAEAGRDARQADAREHDQGPADRPAPGAEARSASARRPSSSDSASGAEICELFPQIGSVIDEICLIRSMTTEAINHDPAHMFMNTGSQIAGRPSMGAWVTYGLGSEAEDLPGFVVLTSLGPGAARTSRSPRGSGQSGFLPSRFQGVHLRGKGDPVLYLSNPPGVIARRSSRTSSTRSTRSTPAINRSVNDPEIATRIAQYEMAFQMQASVPELMDSSGESREDARAVRLPAGRRLVRLELPARPPAGRARRAVHPALSQGLGPPRRREERHRAARPQEVDRACAALITRPEAAGHARRHADRLGRRIRPHADVAGRRRPRPPQQGLLGLAGRRRHQAGPQLRRDRRTGLRRRRERRARSTTCTPRCCICSASTTRASASSSKGSTPGSPASSRARCSATFWLEFLACRIDLASVSGRGLHIFD